MVQLVTYYLRACRLRKILKVTPLFYSIGNAAEEILWAHARAISEKIPLHIIKPYKLTQILGYKICNKELFDLEFKGGQVYQPTKTKQLERLFENIIFVIKRFIHLNVKKFNKYGLDESWHFPITGKNIYWPVQIGYPYSMGFYERDPILNIVHSFKNSPTLKTSKINFCRNKLNEFGIDPKARFVCLHVRDKGFHSDGDRRSYRNAEIENYYSGIQYLLNAGFTVFRMGDRKMRRMKLDHKNLVDYPFTSLKSEIMDLFLVKNCEFYIGMQSGILDVAQLFSRPILMLNMYSWFFAYPFKSCDRGLMKDITFEGRGGLLELKDRFLLPYKYTNEREVFGSEIMFIENSSMQILSAIKQFKYEYDNNFETPPTGDMEINRKLFLEASKNIMSKPDYEFANMPPAHLARITLRNLSSQGYLYQICS